MNLWYYDLNHASDFHCEDDDKEEEEDGEGEEEELMSLN